MKTTLQRKVILTIVIFMLLLASSCGWSQREQMQKLTSDTARKAQLEYEAGDFQKAIDTYKTIYPKYQGDPAFRKDYAGVIESIKRSGDQAFEGGDFALAEKTYETLAQNWADFADFHSSLSFGRDLLEGRIRDSRISLVEMQVRSQLEVGDFQKAMDVYKEICHEFSEVPEIRGGYAKTLEWIKRSGDRALRDKNFTMAENVYDLLIKNWPECADVDHSLSFNRALIERKLKTAKRLSTEKEVQACLKTGDYKRAIDLHKRSYQEYPEDSAVRSGYIKTLESIKIRADQMFERNDPAVAGSIYDTLSKSVLTAAPLAQSLSFNREGLSKRIRSCKEILFQKGLEQYRSGNLSQAVSTWRGILAFDPQDQETRRAVDMAVLQIKNLNKAK